MLPAPRARPDFPAISAKTSAVGDEGSSLSRSAKMIFSQMFNRNNFNVNFIDPEFPATSAKLLQLGTKSL